MKYVVCKHGETRLGTATVTLERGGEGGGMTLVFKSVWAEVCENCGEEYVDEGTTRELLRRAEEAAAAGVQLEVRSYVAA